MDNEKITELLKGIESGDHEAFNTLFVNYYPQVKAFLFGFLKDIDETSDLAQDIFVKLWENRHTLSQIDNFKAYLFRSAKNAVLNHFAHTLIKENYGERIFTNAVSYQNIIEDDIYAEELSLLLDLAVERMPEQRRRIFKMSRKDGLSNEEISVLLNINKRTVENHITNALAELRKIVSSALSILL